MHRKTTSNIKEERVFNFFVSVFIFHTELYFAVTLYFGMDVVSLARSEWLLFYCNFFSRKTGSL